MRIATEPVMDSAKYEFCVSLEGIIKWKFENRWHDVISTITPHIDVFVFDERERRKVEREIPVPSCCYEMLRIMMVRNNARVATPEEVLRKRLRYGF